MESTESKVCLRTKAVGSSINLQVSYGLNEMLLAFSNSVKLHNYTHTSTNRVLKIIKAFILTNCSTNIMPALLKYDKGL